MRHERLERSSRPAPHVEALEPVAPPLPERPRAPSLCLAHGAQDLCRRFREVVALREDPAHGALEREPPLCESPHRDVDHTHESAWTVVAEVDGLDRDEHVASLAALGRHGELGVGDGTCRLRPSEELLSRCDLRLPVVARLDRDPADDLPRGRADQLIPRVARERLELRVGFDDSIVGDPADDERNRRPVKGHREALIGGSLGAPRLDEGGVRDHSTGIFVCHGPPRNSAIFAPVRNALEASWWRPSPAHSVR